MRFPEVAMFEYIGDELRLLRRTLTLRDRLTLLRMGAHLHLHIGRAAKLGRRVPLGRIVEVDLELPDAEFTPGGVSLRVRSNDVPVIEIFGIGAYDVDFAPLGPIETVLDVGANVGTAAIYLARRLPEVRLFCVEASAASFTLLAENLRRNVPTATAINAALVPEPGNYRIEEAFYSGESRVVRDAAQAETSVEGLTLTEILDRANFAQADLMKLDIEGGEIGVFERAIDWAPRVRAILAEVHPPLTVADAQRNLAAHGYTPLPLPPHPKFKELLFMSRNTGGESVGG